MRHGDAGTNPALEGNEYPFDSATVVEIAARDPVTADPQQELGKVVERKSE